MEVSTNGRDFARFPSVSLTPGPVGAYGTIEASNVHNLAGKHPNANGVCTGTPFDLDDLAGHPLVVSGAVDLNDIRYVRIVDVPGNGSFFDDATACLAPGTGPKWTHYPQNHPIYDMWPTLGLRRLRPGGHRRPPRAGALGRHQPRRDRGLSGLGRPGRRLAHPASGTTHWNSRCDLAQPKDLFIRWSRLRRFRGPVGPRRAMARRIQRKVRIYDRFAWQREATSRPREPSRWWSCWSSSPCSPCCWPC